MNAPTRRTPAALPLALAILLLGCGSRPAAAVPGPAPEPGAEMHPPANRVAAADTGTVRVTGTASVSVAASRASLRFAVESRAASAADAARENARQMDAVLSAVREALGDAGDISTEGYGLAPEYRRPEPGDPEGRRIVAYRAVNNVAVTVTDLDRVAPVLDAAVNAGANRVAQLAFVAGDTREARLEAIRLATERATEEARAAAAALGGSLGAVLEVSVSPESRGGGPVMRVAMMEMADASTPVEPGSEEVEVTVNLVWRLAPGSR